MALYVKCQGEVGAKWRAVVFSLWKAVIWLKRTVAELRNVCFFRQRGKQREAACGALRRKIVPLGCEGFRGMLRACGIQCV